MRKQFQDVSKLVDEFVAEARRACTCLPEPVAFRDLGEAIFAMRAPHCPVHNLIIFDPYRSICFDGGEWKTLVAPPNLDDIDDLTPEAADELRKQVAEYEATGKTPGRETWL